MSRALSILLILFPCLSSAQEGPQWYGRIAPAFGQDTLGSEDTRRGTLYGVGFSRPEKRLTFRGMPADLAIEGYYMFTKGGGFEDIPVNKMHTFGAMAIAQYQLGTQGDAKLHLDLGWGLAHNSLTTRDLDSRLNSTPCIGVGVSWGRGDVTVRWYHQSNGGFSGNNQGMNQIQYAFSFKF